MLDQINNPSPAGGSSLRRLRRRPPSPANFALTDNHRQAEEAPPGSAILCNSCKSPVTDNNYAIIINNAHTHTFPNPMGLVFTIRCFATAPGCISHGKANPEFTWFSGYCWEIALCRKCKEHLGWQFYGDDTFFGLIAAKLCEGRKTD